METEDLQFKRKVHHGHNIRRVRIEKEIKQDAMAQLVHLSQPAISRYESLPVIDDEMLQRFAKALEVPAEYLRTLEEDTPSVVFENITNNIHDNSDQVILNNCSGSGEARSSNDYEGDDNHIVNPYDKIAELYERLIKEKDEKYAEIEKRIRSLEQNSQK